MLKVEASALDAAQDSFLEDKARQHNRLRLRALESAPVLVAGLLLHRPPKVEASVRGVAKAPALVSLRHNLARLAKVAGSVRVVENALAAESVQAAESAPDAGSVKAPAQAAIAEENVAAAVAVAVEVRPPIRVARAAAKPLRPDNPQYLPFFLGILRLRQRLQILHKVVSHCPSAAD